MIYRKTTFAIFVAASSSWYSENSIASAFTPSLNRVVSTPNRHVHSSVHISHQSATRLQSTATPPNESTEGQSKTTYTLDLSHYKNLRAFNLKLEDIASECTLTSKSNGVDVITKGYLADALVAKLSAAIEEGNAPFEPDIVTYNTLMKVWARSAQSLGDGRGRGDINQVLHGADDIPEEFMTGDIYTAKDAAERAVTIMTEVEQRYLNGESDVAPNTFGYNIILDGLSKCHAKDAPDAVLSIFEKMKTWSVEGVVDDDYDEDYEEPEEYVNGDAEHWKGIRPDAITYSIVMETLGQSRDGNLVNMVDELLDEVEAEYEKTGDEELKPATRVMNSAINAYLRHSGGGPRNKMTSNKAWLHAKKVHEIFNRCNFKFKETGDASYQPDVTMVTMVIDAYGRCNDVAATERGEYMFEKMYKQWKSSGDDHLKPSSKAFTVMINSWAKLWDPRSTAKVEALLQRMEEMYEEDKKAGKASTSSVKPSIRTYTAAMGAYSRSKNKNKSQQCLRILKKASDMYKETKDESIKPSLYTYNTVIDACARNGGDAEQSAQALKIAFAVNKAIIASKLEPNHVTYSTLLKAANNLLPVGNQRNEICKAVFEKCKEKGYVDTNVLKALEQAADRKLFHSLVEPAVDQNGHVHFDNIPKEWAKNTNY